MLSTARKLVPLGDRVLVRKVEAATKVRAAVRIEARAKRKALRTAARRFFTPSPPRAQTAGGIFLPDANLPKMNEAEVIAVGPGAKDDSGKLMPMDVAVGDMVLLPDYGASPVTIGDDDDELHLLRGQDILGKFA